jgi:hypothetical protein
MNLKSLLSLSVLFAVACSNAAVEVSAGVQGRPPTSVREGDQLLLNIAKVSVHVANEGGVPCNNPGRRQECDDGFITIFEGAQNIDLFNTSELTTFLGTTTVPAGRLTQVRLFLSDANWIREDISLPVFCPSCDKTGLKLVPSDELEVQEGEVLSLDILFDAEHSLIFFETEVLLKPVIHIQANITEQ